MRIPIDLLILCALSGCSSYLSTPEQGRPFENNELSHAMSNESIGEAHMTEDGVIILMLRAESDGVLGDAIIKYYPGDENYEGIIRHLPELRPGGSVRVPPWDN